jgi:hypothetical protein
MNNVSVFLTQNMETVDTLKDAGFKFPVLPKVEGFKFKIT